MASMLNQGSDDLPHDRTALDEEQHWPARIRAGDNIVFERMFRAYSTKLASFADGYVHSLEVAEELVQDVFLWIWMHRESWTPSASVRTYLYGAVRNSALSYLRRKRIERSWTERAGSDFEFLHGEIASADDSLVHDELLALVDTAIAELPESRRSVLMLRWRHRLSYAEIAEVLGSTTKAVEVQLYRTVQALKKRLYKKNI